MEIIVKIRGCLLASFGLIAGLTARANAQEGFPDGTFGTAGFAVTTFAGAAFAFPKDTAVLSDGRILTLSTIWQSLQTAETYAGIARFTADGDVDASFSFDGNVLADFGGDNLQNSISAMAVQTDGKILVCGGVGLCGRRQSQRIRDPAPQWRRHARHRFREFRQGACRL